jgi:CMP/dCMP kinase
VPPYKLAKRITIAIDGPSGAGKSTLARRIAGKLGFLYIDTGAMYRAVALWAVRLHVATSNMHRLEQLAVESRIEFLPGANTVLLNGEDVTSAIRDPGIGEAASQVSQVPAVRRALVERQREIGSQASVVMEGRDIGSIVFPQADVKIFLDAQPGTRAERRARELDLPAHAVSAQLEERDRRDRTRAEAPLLQAPDAVYVDTTGLSIDEVEAVLLKIVRERTSNGKERTH